MSTHAQVVKLEESHDSERRTDLAIWLGVAVLTCVSVWEFSYPDVNIDSIADLALAWGIVMLIWLGTFVTRVFKHRRVRLRDLVVPAVVIVLALTSATSLPFGIRFAIMEPSMTADAKRIIEQPALAKTTDKVGGWEAEEVERFDGGMRFLIPGIGFLDPVGFAYSPGGRPPNLGGEDIYTEAGDGWWVWQESW